MEIDPNGMQDMDGAELYERGSFGRGCEPHHPITHPESPLLPALNRPPADHRPLRPDDGKVPYKILLRYFFKSTVVRHHSIHGNGSDHSFLLCWLR